MTLETNSGLQWADGALWDWLATWMESEEMSTGNSFETCGCEGGDSSQSGDKKSLQC